MVCGENSHTYTPHHLRPQFFPDPDSSYQIDDVYFTRENARYLGLVHGLWNYQAQSNNAEVIPKQFPAVGTCFMFVEPLTICTALSLTDLRILYYKSYSPQEKQKLSF